MQLLILVLDAAGIVISALSPNTLTFFNPMLRPLLFIAMSARVRRAFGSFIRLIPAVADCVLLVLLHLTFFAMLGVLLFGGPEPLLGDDGKCLPRSFRTRAPSLLLVSTFPIWQVLPHFPRRALVADGAAHDRQLSGRDAQGVRRQPRVGALLHRLPADGPLLFDEPRASSETRTRNLLAPRAQPAYQETDRSHLAAQVLSAVFKHYKAMTVAAAAESLAERTRALDEAFELMDISRDGHVELDDFSRLLERIQARSREG